MISMWVDQDHEGQEHNQVQLRFSQITVSGRVKISVRVRIKKRVRVKFT